MAPLVFAAALLVGCRTNAPTEGIALLQPTAPHTAIPPTALDHAVADLAAAALVGSHEEMERALARVESLHTPGSRKRDRDAGLPEMEGLVPLCTDLVNATLTDPIAYREASKELLDSRSGDLDPALEARLRQAVADDPLALADQRIFDHWESLFARTFNTVSEPLGQSLIWGVAVAPFRLANSVTQWAVDLYSQPPVSLRERQALTHRKRYVAKYPDSPETPKVREKVRKAQAELDEMQREHYVELASNALARGSYRYSELLADRALQIDPHDAHAESLLQAARAGAARLEALRARARTSTAAAPADLPYERLAAFLESLLASAPVPIEGAARDREASARIDRATAVLTRVADSARAVRDADGSGALDDEAEYVIALVQHDLGFDAASWERLDALARSSPEASNMARHAESLVSSPWQNTYHDFERQRRRAAEKSAAFRLLGGFAEGTRHPQLSRPVALLVDSPQIAQTILTAPLRLIFGPWEPQGRDYDRATAIAAYRHLARAPYTPGAREVARWLYAYESERENWSAALQLYDLQGEIDPLERIVLVEKAASQRLAVADRADRRDWRSAILQGLVREYPDSNASLTAGTLLRDELENVSPQRIRLSRPFLEENPEVAGARGLGLSPTLLDEDNSNGELHPLGVTFLGGEVLEFALVAESGDPDDPPVSVREVVSPERLSQAAARLDETVSLNVQLDSGAEQASDAYRDHYLERARLGLASEPDMRPAAQSDYVYESLDERYGVVRGRDSVLPFDLVFRGSLYDLSLGAFPRWREPRQTPDAFLYK